MCSLSNPESISLQNRTHFSWHCHAKALRHKSWTFNPLSSTPTCGPCETSNCSWVMPLSEAFPSSHFLRPSALTQASSTVPKRPPQMPPGTDRSDSNHSSLQSPPHIPQICQQYTRLSDLCFIFPLPTELRTISLKVSGSQTVVHRPPERLAGCLLTHSSRAPPHTYTYGSRPLGVGARSHLVLISE